MRSRAAILLTLSAMSWGSCSKDPPPAAMPGPTDLTASPLTRSVPMNAPSELEPALQALRRAPGAYLSPTEAQRAQWKDWLAHLLTAAKTETLPSRAAPPGFAGRFVDGGSIWLVAEQGQKVGAGAYAIRPKAKNDVVIQAPHTFFDQGTLPLSLTLFEALDARALMINTVHRGGSAAAEEGEDERLERARSGKEDADLAHQTDSYYQLAHALLGAEWPQTRFIQVHGFRDEKVPGVSVVVSAAGTGFDPLPVARALNNALGAGTARVYPEEVNKLGGTTNAQARACKEAGWSFLHLEISASLRQRMERQESLREQFARALSQAMLLR